MVAQIERFRSVGVEQINADRAFAVMKCHVDQGVRMGLACVFDHVGQRLGEADFNPRHSHIIKDISHILFEGNDHAVHVMKRVLHMIVTWVHDRSAIFCTAASTVAWTVNTRSIRQMRNICDTSLLRPETARSPR